MAEKVEDKEFLAILRRVLKDYIPHQLLKDVDETQSLRYEGIDLVKYYMKNSKNKLRSYECYGALMKNLRVYSDFPLRRNRYPVDFDQIGDITPKNYHTLKGEVLTCKQDYVFFLQVFFRVNRKMLPSDELQEYVTTLRKRLEGCYEFVRTPENFTDRLSSYLPFNIKNETEEKNESRISLELKKKEENCVDIFKNLISEYPYLFLPNCEAKDKRATAAVRIFETCGGLKFVMESELFNAINLKNPDQKPLECEDRECYLKTIPMKDVYEKYRDHISEIDFIRHSIVRTSHAAVPIATPSGDHCILASDALLEIMRRITSAMNIFQKVTPSTWHSVEKYMKIIEKYFPSDMQYLYFINLDLVKKMQMETDEFWKELDNKPVKLIREVGSFGFNFEDIKKELKYLKLHVVFPDITNHMKQLFTSVFCNKNPNELDTPDLYSAIERCQLNYLFCSFSYLKKIRHYQEFCKPTCCEVCIEIKQKKTERRQAFLRSRPARVKLTEGLRKKGLEAIEETVEATEDNEGVSGETKSFKPSESKKVMESMGKLASSVEYVHEPQEDIEETKKHPESLSEVVSEDAPEKKKGEEDSILNVENLQKIITDLVNESVLKSNGNVLELKNLLLEQFQSSFQLLEDEHRNLRNMRMDMAEHFDNRTIWFNEQQAFIEEIEKRGEEIVELQESEIKAKKETELIIEVKDDEIAKLKEENSRLSKEMKQAEKFKKSQNLMMADKKKEVELLTLNLSTSSQEIKKLSSELSLQKTKEVQIKRSNEEKIEKILSLQHNVVRLEKDAEKHKNDRVQMENRQKQLELEVKEKDRVITEIQNSTTQQIAEHTRVNKKLQETISIMSIECQEQTERNEAKCKTIRKLLAQISSITDPEYSENGPCPLRRQLMGLRKMKDNLEVRSPLKLAKDISERLATLSTRPEIQEMATHEYQQFEGKHQMLLQEVIGNIQKLKEYGDVMSFPPLPEYPSFSDQFVNEYWNAIEIQRTSTLSESTDSGVLEDSECLICFVEMKPDEQTLKCDHCRKILHLECASKWLKIHRSCPHCRREQLDPNEFPALA